MRVCGFDERSEAWIEKSADRDDVLTEKAPNLKNASSRSIVSSTENTGLHASDQSTTSSLSLAKAESRMVSRSKMIVLLVIALAAAACGISTYWFTKAGEEEKFRLQVRLETRGLSPTWYSLMRLCLCPVPVPVPAVVLQSCLLPLLPF